MTKPTNRSLRTLASLLMGSVLASSCSGSGEDVRISFCKQLVMTQVDAPSALRWTRVETHPRGYSGLAVELGFEAQGNARQATCLYRYNAVEDTALTLSDPLSAYATSPETMTIDGEPLSRSNLAGAVKNAMMMQGKAMIDRVQKGIEEAAEQMR